MAAQRLTLLYIVFLPILLKAQNTPTDSLKNIGKAIPDTSKILEVKKEIPVSTPVIDVKKQIKNLFYQLALNFDIARGNQNYANIIPQADLGFENKLVGFKTNSLYNFARLNGKQLNSDLIARNAVSFLPQSKLPIQLLGNGESSKIRNLPSRYQTGLGFGVNLLRKENHHLRLGVNGIIDRSRYNGISFLNDADQKTNLRKTYGPLFQLTGRHELALGRAIIDFTASTYRALNKKKDYRLNYMGTLSFPVFNGLNVRTSMIYSYENVILQNTKHADFFWTFGFGLGAF